MACDLGSLQARLLGLWDSNNLVRVDLMRQCQGTCSENVLYNRSGSFVCSYVQYLLKVE